MERWNLELPAENSYTHTRCWPEKQSKWQNAVQICNTGRRATYFLGLAWPTFQVDPVYVGVDEIRDY
jgi:hypothetical protein